MDYNEIKNKYNEALSIWNATKEHIDNTWDWNLPFYKFEEYIYDLPEYKEYCKWLEMEKKYRPTYTSKTATSFDIHCRMSLQEFIDAAKTGLIMDYDGIGKYGTLAEVTDIAVSPSDITDNIYRDDFTHIYWYNRLFLMKIYSHKI